MSDLRDSVSSVVRIRQDMGRGFLHPLKDVATRQRIFKLADKFLQVVFHDAIEIGQLAVDIVEHLDISRRAHEIQRGATGEHLDSIISISRYSSQIRKRNHRRGRRKCIAWPHGAGHHEPRLSPRWPVSQAYALAKPSPDAHTRRAGKGGLRIKAALGLFLKRTSPWMAGLSAATVGQKNYYFAA